MALLDKVYRPGASEDKWYQYWFEKKYFQTDPHSGKPSFTIVIPPPNVTGMLTMGHVLNNTIQDILIRKARMEGKEACWIPGTDHASIATEAKVVEMLGQKGIRKEALSRKEFLQHAWSWKEKYGGIIISQLKKLGCSCDWQRARFTLDEGYSRAVLEAFVRLYHKGLIYRGHRLVNWCPVSKSAISDEEVIYRQVDGELWYFRYPLVNSDAAVIVATTRPETMLGDTAVAINPHDERFKSLLGEKVKLPLVGREIPIIADDFVDPEFGTGCVKVTPAHDPNDFTMGKTHNLEFVNIMNEDASLNDNVPEPYRGLSREAARDRVVEDLKAQGYLEKVADYTNNVGYSERGNVPIEYYISEQWYLKMKALAQPALEAVNSGRIQFHPEHWIKTYNHWMENIKDWCISRQLWWGHRIPVYTCQACNEVMVQVDLPETCSKCNSTEIEQDPDVLDTWASSWLWPFAVHNWPNDEPDRNFFYPTDVLVTGPDIIFFWVARMIMAGIEFKGGIPFEDVYFTSILRDEIGRKFSKSLGNSPDPLDLFADFGTDAVRFGIMLMAPQGLDVLFASSRLEVGRNFMNKLWNAARFVQMNLENGKIPEFDGTLECLDLPERWILKRLNQTINNVNRQLKRFHFNEAAKVIYDFTWGDFCDWYIEIAKIRLSGGSPAQAEAARAVSVYVLKQILALLHPYAPFITEELWSHFKRASEPDLIVSVWPTPVEAVFAPADQDAMDFLQAIITALRTIRSRMNVPPSKKAEAVFRCDEQAAKYLYEHEEVIKSLARLEMITTGNNVKKPAHSATAVVRHMEIFVPLEGLIDLELERRRLEKRTTEIEEHLLDTRKKLDNQNFLNRAPESVVDRERQKQADMQGELEKVVSNLEMLQ